MEVRVIFADSVEELSVSITELVMDGWNPIGSSDDNPHPLIGLSIKALRIKEVRHYATMARLENPVERDR